MDKTNLKSLKDVDLDLLDLAGKLLEVAETLDAIVASELKSAKEEPKKKTGPKQKIVKEVKPKAAKKASTIEDKPKAKRGRPVKSKK